MPRRSAYVKRPHEEHQFTPQQVMELKRCMNDPIYFIETYIKIVHPTQGAVHFNLYDYQKKLINAYHKKRDVIVLSARQTGKSITAAAYILWFTIFQFDKTVLVASNKEDGAKDIVHRIKYAYEYLPNWIKPGVLDGGWNMFSIAFDNGSRILSEATSESSGRGSSISLLYLDEFAFVSETIAEEFWTSISPTLSTGGDCIITSTPNGDMNLFAQMWRGAELGVNGFEAVRIRWDEAPGHDEAYKEREIARLGERKWMQEHECIFLSSDALLMDSLFLANETPRIENLEPLFKIRDISFWKKIQPGKTYLMGVDPSTGSGEDFSVITVFAFPEMEQVCEFRSNTMSPPHVYAVIKNLARYIEREGGHVYFTVENNGVGEGIISLFEADENPLERAEFVSEEGAKRYGITTTNKTKMRSCVNFKEMVEKGNMTMNSLPLLKELKSFVRKGASYQAQIGATDDSVCACLLVIRLLEEIASYDQEAYNKLYMYKEDNWFDNTPEEEYDESNPEHQPLPFTF